MKLLHIDSSVLGPNSVSRQVSAAIVDRLRAVTPGVEVVYRDLTQTPLAHLSGLHVAALHGAEPEAALQPDIAAGQQALDEFLAADTVVIGAAMYNFAISSQLKAWIDRVLVVGKTFKYSDNGLEGLAGNKRVIVAVSRGLLYGAGMPNAPGEHVVSYLRWVFGYMGIAHPEIIIAEGTQMGAELREKSIATALLSVDGLTTGLQAA